MKNTFLAALIVAATLAPSNARAAPQRPFIPNTPIRNAMCEVVTYYMLAYFPGLWRTFSFSLPCNQP